tara:strand:+ start:459 stop:1088 length:630 start_codon:yes stop_codon:yes gene_type:complete
MVYFLGRDVEVYVTTEAPSGASATGIYVTANGALALTSGSGDSLAFLPLNSGTSGNRSSDVTGVDVSIGAVDEDITYFGIRSTTKAEIKKETTVTLTKKKNDNVMESIYSGARYGVSGSSVGDSLSDGLTMPSLQKVSSNISYGYRIHVVLKSGSEVFTIPNNCVQAHTVSINADGTQEETIEFMSYVSPLVTTGASADITGATTSANI